MKYKICKLEIDGVTIKYTVPNEKVTSVFFLGLGQQGKNLIWVADKAPEGMCIVEAVSYTQKRTRSEMTALGVDSVKAILQLFDLREVDVYCESQSAPAVILTLGKFKIHPRSIVCITPLGFNYNQMGSNNKMRQKKLSANSRKFWRSWNQRLSLKANRETFKYAVLQHSFRPKVTMEALDYVANINLSGIAEKIAASIPVHIFATTNDELFPFSQIEKQLGQYTKINLHELKNSSHLNRATPKGITQLNAIFEMMNPDRN